MVQIRCGFIDSAPPVSSEPSKLSPATEEAGALGGDELADGVEDPGHLGQGLHELPDHVRRIALLRGLGYSYTQIAGEVRMSPRGVSVTLSEHRRSLKSLRAAMESSSQLSVRAANTLGRHGIRTREEARSANLLEILGRERNCGRKTLDEIARWVEHGNDQSFAPLGSGAG